jgi:hypothetical protein
MQGIQNSKQKLLGQKTNEGGLKREAKTMSIIDGKNQN